MFRQNSSQKPMKNSLLSLGFWKSGLMFINLHYIGEAFISGQNVLSSIQLFKPGQFSQFLFTFSNEHVQSKSSLESQLLFYSIRSVRNNPRSKVINDYSVIEHLSSVSSLVFVIIRVVSLALTFIVFHFGFGHQPSTQWNTPRTRILALLVVSFVQVCTF